MVQVGGRGQSGCERTIKVFVKFFFFYFFGGCGVLGGSGWGGGGVRVDVNEELKF